jgi:hypothetical protein
MRMWIPFPVTVMRDNQAATKSTFTRRPNAFAARERVCSVTAVLSGSSKRSKAAREVPILRAISDLLICRFVMRSASFSASVRFKAASSTSSRMPSARRKSSRLLPRWGFSCLAVLRVGIFSFQGQRPVLRWGFLSLLDESMHKDDFLEVNKKQSACESRSHLPQAISKMIHERHPEGPAELHCFQVLADSAPFVGRKRLQPCAKGLIATRGLEEYYGQRSILRHTSECINSDTPAKRNLRRACIS